jgi:hypothetical protein
MPLLTALIPTADWSGPNWWVFLVPLIWFTFFFLVFLTLRRFGPWGCGRGRGCGPRYDRRWTPKDEEDPG